MTSETESCGERQKPRDIKERTFEFALAIIRLCQPLERRTGASRTLGSQLMRSGTSIGANVEEAHAGQSKADFISKYSIALKEARETRYWLRLLEATGSAPPGTCQKMLDESDQLIRIIAAIIVSVKGRKQS